MNHLPQMLLVERTFGRDVHDVIETILDQVKSPVQYLEEMAGLGVFPELADPNTRQQILEGIMIAATYHLHRQWVIFLDQQADTLTVWRYHTTASGPGWIEVSIPANYLLDWLGGDSEDIAKVRRIVSTWMLEAEGEQEDADR